MSILLTIFVLLFNKSSSQLKCIYIAICKLPKIDEAKNYMKNKRITQFISILFITISICFYEFILRYSYSITTTWFSIFIIFISALAIGSLTSLSGKFAFVFLELICIWYIITFFTYQSYTVFMPLSMVLSEASDVVTDFRSTLTETIIKGIPIIIIYHIPSILFLFFINKVHMPKKKFELLSGVVPFSLSLIILSIIGYTNPKFITEYEYSNAVKTLGIPISLPLEIINSNSNQTMTISSSNSDSIQVEEKNYSSNSVLRNYNTMDLEFVNHQSSEKNAEIAKDLNEYVKSLTPSAQNEYTGLFEGKNLIVICAEAFCEEVIDEQRTPTLYRLANNGIKFEDFYQPTWGGSTSTGEFSILSGLIPFASNAMDLSKHDNMYFTMANQLKRIGYTNLAFHNGSYSYYERFVTHKNLGYTKFIGKGNGLKYDSHGWPASDLEMMENTIDYYIDQQPFNIYYMTISAHGNYLFDNSVNKMCVKNQEYVEDLDASEPVKAYLSANMELEFAVEYLVNKLEEKEIADDTVIVLCADHYPYCLTKMYKYNDEDDYMLELYKDGYKTNPQRDHNALIIWSGCLEDEDPIVVSEPTYSVDILPTLSNLFGLEYDSRLMVGRDVFSDEEPLVIWNDYSFLTSKGYYDSVTNKFTPNQGCTVSDEYINNMKEIVRQKKQFSRNIICRDYYGYLFGDSDN